MFDSIPIEKDLPIIFLFYLKFTRIFCRFSRDFIKNEIEQFVSTSYTTSFLTEREQFEKYFNLQINQFQKCLP